MEKVKRNYLENNSYYKTNKNLDTLDEVVKQKQLVSNQPLDSLASNSEFKNYYIKIKVAALNIRKGPGFNYPIINTIRDNKTYTIILETSDSSNKKWDKLKFPEGWISLDYVEKV